MSDATTAPGDAHAAAEPVMTHRMIMFVIFGLMAGMFLSALDQTVVGTAIRTIGDDLHGLSQQAWVTTAYLIVSTISTPIYGKLSDIFGRRPLFIFAIVVFMIGSILASFSTSMIQLAAFRAIQGLGAGGLMSMPLAIMGDILAPRERAKYQGYFLAVFGVSSVHRSPGRRPVRRRRRDPGHRRLALGVPHQRADRPGRARDRAAVPAHPPASRALRAHRLVGRVAGRRGAGPAAARRGAGP